VKLATGLLGAIGRDPPTARAVDAEIFVGTDIAEAQRWHGGCG
jgi:hypothetical protein